MSKEKVVTNVSQRKTRIEEQKPTVQDEVPKVGMYHTAHEIDGTAAFQDVRQLQKKSVAADQSEEMLQSEKFTSKGQSVAAHDNEDENGEDEDDEDEDDQASTTLGQCCRDCCGGGKPPKVTYFWVKRHPKCIAERDTCPKKRGFFSARCAVVPECDAKRCRDSQSPKSKATIPYILPKRAGARTVEKTATQWNKEETTTTKSKGKNLATTKAEVTQHGWKVNNTSTTIKREETITTYKKTESGKGPGPGPGTIPTMALTSSRDSWPDRKKKAKKELKK